MRATLPLGLAGLMMSGMMGCAEPPTGSSTPVVVPSSPPSSVVALTGTVDLDRGTLEFAPMAPSSLAGFSPAIYGDQNVNIRLYNSPVALDSSTSTWRWTANVGIRNMRPHYIGDEENSVAPIDTMGVFVFFVQEPILGQPCAGCFARIANYQGAMSFDAPNRKFFYWPERLNPMGSPLGDTTRVRRSWTFETSAGVRSFSFNVLVDAAWPSPYETRWKVEYTADALPGSLGAPWKLEGTSGNASVSGGSLALRGGSSALYYRRDPIAPEQDAYVHAVLRLNGGGSQPEIGILLSDRVRLIAVGVANGTIGLISNAGTFLPGTTASLGNGTHAVQLRKYAADSAAYFVDGVRRGAAAYGSLSLDTFTPALSSVLFGALPTSGASNSIWDTVIYEIGVVSP